MSCRLTRVATGKPKQSFFGGPHDVDDYRDESDGPWSTFELKLNTASGWKAVRLLPSFSVAAIFAIDSSACVNTSTKDCAERHVGLLQINASSDWANAGEYSLELGNDVGFKTISGRFGFQSAALPTSETGTVNGQAVALMDESTFELGLMGLAPNNTAALTFSRQYSSITDSLSSTSDDIHGSKMGARWGYIAGSFRRNFFASLTFGGYDLSGANFTGTVKNEISANSSSLFQVVLEGITVRSNNYSNFGAGGSAESAVKATIEPALPYLWLPEYWCCVIANAFILAWDSERELYSVPDDLDVESPDYKVSFRLYFAMRPSESVILGRVFLQETYLFADYDQKFFRIGRAIFNRGSRPMFIDSEDRPAHPVLDTGKIV
ncbi:hypothetical protein IWX90DRAFT_419102 [Phyllosticta citrichinensis]|uniref:Acid protease n=1 Tax=Phyllosticta citrichinensis TaxID=1130410 RepID=A0ABR1XG74_9PEZI